MARVDSRTPSRTAVVTVGGAMPRRTVEPCLESVVLRVAAVGPGTGTRPAAPPRAVLTDRSAAAAACTALGSPAACQWAPSHWQCGQPAASATVTRSPAWAAGASSAARPGAAVPPPVPRPRPAGWPGTEPRGHSGWPTGRLPGRSAAARGRGCQCIMMPSGPGGQSDSESYGGGHRRRCHAAANR